MTKFNDAIEAYQKSGGKSKINIMASHYDLKLDIWYLVSDKKLICTFTNNKLEIL